MSMMQIKVKTESLAAYNSMQKGLYCIERDIKDKDALRSIVCAVAIVSGEDRLAINCHTGGYAELQETLVLQMIGNLTIFPEGIPWYRKAVYWLVFQCFGMSFTGGVIK